jgi:hypothetical protein
VISEHPLSKLLSFVLNLVNFCLDKSYHHRVHPTQIAQWKKQALDGLPDVFSVGKSKQEQSEEALIASLYQQIGQLKVQVDWLEKKSKPLR